MAVLSTPPESPESPGPGPDRARAAEWAVRVVVPVIVAVLFIGMLALERSGPDYDLQLLSPTSAVRGATLPVHAYVFRGMGRPEGPEPVDAPVRVLLRDANGATLDRTDLVRSPVLGRLGSLRVPASARGPLRLEAHTDAAHGGATVLRPVELPDAPEPVRTRVRTTVDAVPGLGPVQVVGTSTAPSELDLRVRGGVCVPELPCRLLVWVGEPAAAIRLEASGPLEIRGPSTSPRETAGIVGFDAVVHGPEPVAIVVALRGGVEVARREVGLPIAMGGIVAEVGPPLLDAPARPTIRVDSLEGASAVEIDVIRDGSWIATVALARSEAARGAPLPMALGPGLYRLQVRRDAVAVDASAEAHVLVSAAGTPDALVRLAGEPLGELPDPFARHVAEGSPVPDTPAADVARFLTSFAEARVVPLPPTTSAAVQESFGTVRVRSRAREAVALVILLLGFVSSAVVVRRGLRSRDEAIALLREAEVEDADSEARRRRLTRTALWAGLLVLFGFVVAAVLVLSRGLV